VRIRVVNEVRSLDGDGHGAYEHFVRDRVIEAEGYCVLRFWNHNVRRDLETVMETIMRHAEQRRPPTRSGFAVLRRIARTLALLTPTGGR